MPEQYAADVRELCDRWSIDVIVPITEESLLTLLQPRWKPPGVCIPFASLDAFRAISDKARMVHAAQSVGIAVPEQQQAPSRTAAAALTESLSYPVVLKPARSVVLNESAQAKLSVRHAATPDEFRVELERLPDAAFPLLVQRRIVGPGVGVFVLLWDGELRACFMHRRLREKPPSGGVSVYCESIPLDAALVRRVVALLQCFEWQGVAMAEMKVDRVSGTPHLMEVNGRFWGSLQLAAGLPRGGALTVVVGGCRSPDRAYASLPG
jgi:predicted ATP-grasp superfamily ATP-dependent carboligase